MTRSKRAESNDPRWVTLADAAERIQMDQKSVRRLISSGLLPAVRIGPKAIRIRESDLDALARPL